MARAQEKATPETATDAQPEQTAEKPKRTRKAVPMVTTHPDEINFEVAGDHEIRTGRTRTVLADAQQDKIKQGVQASFDSGKWLAVNGKPGSKDELIKRLRHAAAELGYGMSIGLVTEDSNGVRVPFKAGKRKVYKRQQKAE